MEVDQEVGSSLEETGDLAERLDGVLQILYRSDVDGGCVLHNQWTQFARLHNT